MCCGSTVKQDLHCVLEMVRGVMCVADGMLVCWFVKNVRKQVQVGT